MTLIVQFWPQNLPSSCLSPKLWIWWKFPRGLWHRHPIQKLPYARTHGLIGVASYGALPHWSMFPSTSNNIFQFTSRNRTKFIKPALSGSRFSCFENNILWNRQREASRHAYIETTKIVFVFVFYRGFALDPLRELMTLYPLPTSRPARGTPSPFFT